MQIVKSSLPGSRVVFESILDEIPGGVSIKVARLDNLTVNANVDKRFLPAGTPVYVDLAARTADICKSAAGLAGTTAQAIRVTKNSHYKVGELINDGVTSAVISSIDTTAAGYDVINTAAALIYAEGTKYGEGSASGTSAALLFTPNGLTKDVVWMGDGNADGAIVTIGSVRADALVYPINALYAAALRGSKSLITLV